MDLIEFCLLGFLYLLITIDSGGGLAPEWGQATSRIGYDMDILHPQASPNT